MARMTNYPNGAVIRVILHFGALVTSSECKPFKFGTRIELGDSQPKHDESPLKRGGQGYVTSFYMELDKIDVSIHSSYAIFLLRRTAGLRQSFDDLQFYP